MTRTFNEDAMYDALNAAVNHIADAEEREAFGAVLDCYQTGAPIGHLYSMALTLGVVTQAQYDAALKGYGALWSASAEARHQLAA